MKNIELPKAMVRKAMVDVDNMLYEQHLKCIFDKGDPNHPMYNNGYNYATGHYTLFGYDQDEFLAKQYK